MPSTLWGSLRRLCPLLMLSCMLSCICVHAQVYSAARRAVDRLPHLIVRTNVEGTKWFEGSDILRPKLNVPDTYGPFGPYTQLPGDCYLYKRQNPYPGDTESNEPIPVSQWASTNTTSTNEWYGFLCVTDESVLIKSPGVAFSFLRDIAPVLESGKSTWAQRLAWGSQGFAYYLCRGIDQAWLTYDPVTRATKYGTNNPALNELQYACVESYLGFFHQGLPRPANHPDPAAYVIPNPTIPYFCVSRTTFFWNGNNNDPALQTDIDATRTEQYAKYTTDCYAKDEFGDRYLDENGNALTSGIGLPSTLPCSSLQPTDQILKMVEVCQLSFLTNATGIINTDYAYACTLQCRYPCITQTEYMTYQSQTAASVCSPAARISQCNRDVRSISTQFCQPTESFSAFKVAPNSGLNTFENDITTECSVGDLGCRILCHCRNDAGCPNHIVCNGHGTLFDTSIESHPPLTPTCMCEPGRVGDTCEKPVSSVICNHGQEL